MMFVVLSMLIPGGVDSEGAIQVIVGCLGYQCPIIELRYACLYSSTQSLTHLFAMHVQSLIHNSNPKVSGSCLAERVWIARRPAASLLVET